MKNQVLVVWVAVQLGCQATMSDTSTVDEARDPVTLGTFTLDGFRPDTGDPHDWWFDTGLDVTSTTNLSFSCAGLISPFPGDPGRACDGTPGRSFWDLAIAGAACPFASLVGKIGRDGTPFCIGVAAGFQAGANGRLFIGFNDGERFTDNSGVWQVRVDADNLPDCSALFGNRTIRGRSCQAIIADANLLSQQARLTLNTHFTREQTETLFDAAECRTGVPAQMMRAYSWGEGLGAQYDDPYPRQFIEPCEQAYNQNGTQFFRDMFRRYYGRKNNAIRWPLITLGYTGAVTELDYDSADWPTGLSPDIHDATFRCSAPPAPSSASWDALLPDLQHVTLGDDRPSGESVGLGLMQVTFARADLLHATTPLRFFGIAPADQPSSSTDIFPVGGGRPVLSALEMEPQQNRIADLITDPQYNIVLGAETAANAWQQVRAMSNLPDKMEIRDCRDRDYGRLLGIDGTRWDSSVRQENFICAVGSIKTASGSCATGLGQTTIRNALNFRMGSATAACFCRDNNIRFDESCRSARTHAFALACNDFQAYCNNQVPAGSACDAPAAGTANLSGRAFFRTAPNPVALPGARVSACPVSGACHSTVADDGSAYEFSNLPAGSYTITVFPPASTSYLPGTRVVDLVAGTSVIATDLVLDPPVPPPPGTTLSSHDETVDGIPIVYRRDPVTLTTTACPGGTASFLLARGDDHLVDGAMIEDLSGTYSTTFGPLDVESGPAVVSTTVRCPSSPAVTASFNIYIDPSGVVVNQDGRPVRGATVTLLRSDAPDGPFVDVPDASSEMSPMNRDNPMQSRADGSFGWDVVPGYYKVRAAKAGCVALDHPVRRFAESRVLTVPPPALDLSLALHCPSPTPVRLDLRSVCSPDPRQFRVWRVRNPDRVPVRFDWKVLVHHPATGRVLLAG